MQVANCGPADYNFDETISTLRYANRAKNIQNKARINEDPKDALLRQYQEQIEALRAQLESGAFFAGFCVNFSFLKSSPGIQHHTADIYLPIDFV